MRVVRPKEEECKEISDVYGVFYFVSINDIRAMLNKMVIIKKEKEIVGLLSTNKPHDTIKMLVVKKKYRERGIGKKLFDKGVEMLKIPKKGMEILATHSPTSSIEFWKKLGFEEGEIEVTKKGNKMMKMRYPV